LGNWKDFEDLESNLSMPELTATLNAMRESEHREQKFLAAIQGIDLDKNSGSGQKEWEDLKSRVFSGGAATDSNDIVSLQGVNASQAGFGIGMGLEYTDAKDLTQIPSW
jgi:translation initiation factor 1 (eIF-1/SUI1)